MLPDKGHVDKSGRVGSLPHEAKWMAYQGPLQFNRFKNNAFEIKGALNVANIRIYDSQLVPSHILETCDKNNFQEIKIVTI